MRPGRALQDQWRDARQAPERVAATSHGFHFVPTVSAGPAVLIDLPAELRVYADRFRPDPDPRLVLGWASYRAVTS